MRVKLHSAIYLQLWSIRLVEESEHLSDSPPPCPTVPDGLRPFCAPTPQGSRLRVPETRVRDSRGCSPVVVKCRPSRPGPRRRRQEKDFRWSHLLTTCRPSADQRNHGGTFHT